MATLLISDNPVSDNPIGDNPISDKLMCHKDVAENFLKCVEYCQIYCLLNSDPIELVLLRKLTTHIFVVYEIVASKIVAYDKCRLYRQCRWCLIFCSLSYTIASDPIVTDISNKIFVCIFIQTYNA